jgi:predicted nucleotidyltransferase
MYATMSVLSRNGEGLNDVTVDIDLSVYGKSFAETMAGKRKQMSTSQKQLLCFLSTKLKIYNSIRKIRMPANEGLIFSKFSQIRVCNSLLHNA